MGKELTLPAAMRCEVLGKFRMHKSIELLQTLVMIDERKLLIRSHQKVSSRLFLSMLELRRHCATGG